MPGSEEYVADTGMNGDCSRILNAGLERFPVPAVVQFSNVHVLRVSVHPVQLVVDPVDCNAFKAVSVVVDQHLSGVVCHSDL